MTNYIIKETEEYDKLVPFFIENELEFTEDDAIEVPTYIQKCWEIIEGEDPENGRLIGAFVLGKREGEYICDGIAIDKAYRKSHLGKSLLELAIEEIRANGGKRIYLVARAPEFFRKQGFNTVSREEAPNFFECLTCPQYGVSCHPEVMLYNL